VIDELAAGRGGVDAFGERAEVYAVISKTNQKIGQGLQRSRSIEKDYADSVLERVKSKLRKTRP
jgi:hypothetical protein